MKAQDAILIGVLVLAAILLIAIPIGLLLLSAVVPQPACVGLIRVNGEIVTESTSDMFGEGPLSSDAFAALLKEAQSSDEIKSVLIEINSPGGSAVASDEMYRAAKEFKKPKVMYIREMGASGGFYLAMAGDTIMAHPAALTGNMGVRSTFADMSGLLEKIGVNLTNVKSGEFKDIGDINRPPTDAEIAMMQEMINEEFNEFKQIVYDARSGKPRFTDANFNTITDARILTGKQAYNLGLVDELGWKEDAVNKAAKLGGINEPDPPICELSQSMTFFEAMFSSSSNVLSRILTTAIRNAAMPASEGASIKLG